MVNAQEWLDKNYPSKEERKKIRLLDLSDLGKKNTIFSSEKRLEGHLDLSDFVDLGNLDCSDNLLTSIDVSKCSRLRILRIPTNNTSEIDVSNNPLLRRLNWVDEYCPHKHKIIGWEKTSLCVFNLVPRVEYAFTSSRFLWKGLLNTYETYYPEMPLIDISDLNQLADRVINKVSRMSLRDKEFIKILCPQEPEPLSVPNFSLSDFSHYEALDQIANRILARCLILSNRLYQGTDQRYEQEITDLSLLLLRCPLMGQCRSFLYGKAIPVSIRQELINKVLSGDPELINRVKDLPWIKLTSQILEKALLNLTTEKNELSTQLATLTSEKSTLESILTENQGKCTTLESTLAENQTTISTLKKTKGELEQNLSNLQTSKNNLETELKGKISTLEKEVKELDQTNSTLQTNLLTLSTSQTTLKEQLKNLTDEKNTLAQKLAEYDRIRDETLERIKAGKLLPDPKEEHLRAKYKEAYETNEHLRSLIETYETDKASYQKTLENWAEQLSDLEGKRDAKTTELNNLTVKHSQLEKELTKSQANYRELEAKEQNTSQQLTEKSAELEQERKNFSELQTHEKNTSEQLSQKTTELERTSQELANTSRELETTQTNLTNQIATTKELQAKLNEKEIKLKDLNEQLESKNNNLQTQSAILNSLIAKAREIKIKLEKAHQRADSLLNPKPPRQIFLEKYWPAFLLIPVALLLSLLITKNFKSKKKTPKPVVKSTEKPEKANEPISEIPTEKTFSQPSQPRNSKGQFTKKNPKRHQK